jgi:hypothetical protein
MTTYLSTGAPYVGQRMASRLGMTVAAGKASERVEIPAKWGKYVIGHAKKAVIHKIHDLIFKKARNTQNTQNTAAFFYLFLVNASFKKAN